MAILQTLMSYLSLHPQPLKQPSTALHFAQYTQRFLSSSESNQDTQETWFLYEQLFLASLRIKDDQAARLCLQRLSDRFGIDSPRVLALSGLYDEATATSRHSLEDILKRYDDLLTEDPTNILIEKRRVALLESLDRVDEAIHALTQLLEISPTDAEAWSHLASLYRTQGLYAQSIFCLEEVLLIHPNAYNIHTRLGETIYMSATTGGGSNAASLADAIRYYCRSVELCEWYLRGWYGLRVVTDKILASSRSGGSIKNQSGGLERKLAEDLNAKATNKLAEIVRRSKAGENGWQGFDLGELEAAQELIATESVAK
jgi:tetratricopeptide (TPR) repeat protein